jgi:2,4-dienoyl-CoA reductase-like NADH-dependent reductase (Old Yellow Enzyme family)
MSMLFSCFRLRDAEFKNHNFLSPLSQYSGEDGLLTGWLV